jgi:cation/acetate symporter
MFNWAGLLLIGLLWVLAILLVLGVLAILFPPIKRKNENSENVPSGLLPWYPISRPPRANIAQTAISEPVQPGNPFHWKLNVRLIFWLLSLWLVVSIGSVAFAPALNQFTILTGFPLGYFMGGQGALWVFLIIIWFYIWRASRLDRKFYPNSTAVTPTPPINIKRIARVYLLFALSLGGLVWVMGTLEANQILPVRSTDWTLLATTLGLYAIIGWMSRTKSLDEYFVAGRRIPAFFNGIAIAGDWMSAASFISMAGTLWLLGYEGLAYIMGWTGGYVLLAMLIAPYLRKFGQFTIPDFIAARYDGNLARVTSAIISVFISFTYVTAQVAGIGLIMTRFIGVNYYLGVMVGLGSVLFCSFLGGMRAITWTQVAQCIVLLFAYLAPVTLLSLRETGVPLPQFMYGDALRNITLFESQMGITQSYIEPFNVWTPWNFLALMLCLMLGTAGMPHILMRFYTVPTTNDARRSTGWALMFIMLLYLTAPAYAAFSRYEILKNVIGKPIVAVPEWATTWAQFDLIKFADKNADNILQFDELSIHPDLVVVATPDIAQLPRAISALVAAGGLSAALSTADGLLLVIASALSHDIYNRAFNPNVSLRNRFLLGRVTILFAAVVAAFTAIQRLPIIVQLVAYAFSFAASTFFPALVLGIFWKRANSQGAVAGMIVGFCITLLYLALNTISTTYSVLGIKDIAAGIFGIPANILVTVIVSKLTPPPSKTAQDLVESLRQP